MKQLGDKIAMLTAYDYSMANVIDQAGVDAILVGDSASNVMVGNRTTLPMTVIQMIYHGKSVMNGVKRALVVIDMRLEATMQARGGCCQCYKDHAETEADALKLEGEKR